MAGETKLLGFSNISDFERALKFYNRVLQVFGESYFKLQITFPQKYDDKKDFIDQFNELDDVERLLWCDHQLKQAYLQYNKRDGGQTARKNILWTLMVCKQFKIILSKDYQLMKMIRELWMDSKTAKQKLVKDSLNQIFMELGQVPSQTNQKNIISSQTRKSQTIGCCGASKCQIF